jgi:iron complex outermembrane recepter protein
LRGMLQKKTLFCLLYLACILLAWFPTLAQHSTDSLGKPVFKSLDSVEVSAFMGTSYIKSISATGSKTATPVIDFPQTISTVSRQLIDDKMNFTLREAVTSAANVNSYSGYDEYTIRGFRAENPRNINGLRGYNSTYTSLLLLNIESIDVIKGPAAALYGNSDPGGNINLVTKKPLPVSSGQIDVFGGSWNHFRATGDFTGPLNDSKTFLYRLNAGYDQSDGFSDQFYSKAFQIAPSFTFIPCRKLQINLDLSYSDIHTILYRGQPGLEGSNDLYATPVSLSLTQPGDYLKEKDLSSLLSVTWKITDKFSFHSAWLNYQTKQHVAEHGFDSYINFDSVNLYYQQWQFNTSTNSLSNYFKYDFRIGQTNQDLVLGYDYISTHGNVDQTRYENPDIFGSGSGIVGTFNLLHPLYNQMPVSSYKPSAVHTDADGVDQYYTQGIYIQDQISFKSLNFLIGLRREYYNKNADAGDSAGTAENVWLPRFGLVYDITKDLHVYGIYSRGFDPYEISSSTAVYNAPFKPISSELYELGLKAMLLKGKIYGTISIYQLSIFNVAVNANDPSNPDLYVQRGEDQARGIEFEMNGYILPNLEAHIAYAYNLAKIKQSLVKEDIGMLKENAPVHSGNGFFKYNFTKGRLKEFSFVAGYTWESKRNTLDKEIQLPGYITFLGGLNYRCQPFTISFLMNNIGNTVYWSGAYNNVYKWPGQGRNFMIKLSTDLLLNKSGNK